MLGMSWASAETVTWVAADQGYENAEAVETIVVDDAVTVTLGAGTNSNAPKYYDGGSALRVYAGNTITFACTQELTQIVFNCVSSSYVASETTEVTAGDYTIEDATLTWTGSAYDMELTTGAGNQFRIVSMEITYGGEPVARPNYTAEGFVTNPPADWGWADNLMPECIVTVDSYDGYFVIKSLAGVEGYDVAIYYDEDTNVTNIISYENGEVKSEGTDSWGYAYIYTGLTGADEVYSMAVYIGSGYTYAYDNGTSEGYTALTVYYYYNDEEATTPWGTWWVEWPYVAPVESVSSLNALTDFADGAEFEMGIDLTVVYANGSYNYVTDGTTYALIYKYGLGLEAGDVIAAGWQGEMSIYNNLPELVPTTDIEVSGTATVPDPTHVETADVAMNVAANNLCAYLCLEGIVFEDATPESGSFTGLAGEDTINFYNRFSVASVEAGTYNVTGFVSIYKDTVQFQPIAIEEPGEEPVQPEPVLVWSATGRVKNNDVSGWESLLNYIPECTATVDCYEDFVIVRGFAGVEGYDLKVCYDATASYPSVTSVAAIIDGVEGDATTSGYASLYTGLYDWYCLQPYISSGYGYCYDYGESYSKYYASYLMLYSYFVNEDGDSFEGVYFVEWGEAALGISSVKADGNGEAQYYNLQGIRVANPEAGKVYIRIADGKASKIVK